MFQVLQRPFTFSASVQQAGFCSVAGILGSEMTVTDFCPQLWDVAQIASQKFRSRVCTTVRKGDTPGLLVIGHRFLIPGEVEGETHSHRSILF